MTEAREMQIADSLALFRSMLRIRVVEESIADHYSEQEMRCPVHLSTGQEAAAVGACAALDASDVIVSNHRSHSHYLAKGGNLNAMLGEIYGRATGCCGGRGGSMHLFDQSAGILASVPIVGSTIPLAVGAALAFHQHDKPNVSIAFLGDAQASFRGKDRRVHQIDGAVHDRRQGPGQGCGAEALALP